MNLIEAAQEFMAERGIAITDGTNPFRDPYAIEKAEKRAIRHMVEHTPARYVEAFPHRPEILDWVEGVIREAIDQSERRPTVGIHSGRSLLLLGPTGTGKTYEAYGAMRLISACGIASAWQVISAADLYARLRPRHRVDSEAEFRAVVDAPLLAVDDLGAAKTSEWVEEINFRLINHRYEREMPTLFTSNIAPTQLAESLGERVTSRLIEMTSRVVIEGPDRRRAA